MLARDGFLDLDCRKQGAGKRHVLDDRDAVFLCLLADAQRHLVDALGHADRRRIDRGIIAQRDRIVRRIGDDHSRLRHVLHHALARSLKADLAQARTDLRVALLLLDLVADILARHPHALHEGEALEEVVDCRNDADDHDRRQQQPPSDHLRHDQQALGIQPA